MNIWIWIIIAAGAAFGVWVAVKTYRKMDEIGRIQHDLNHKAGHPKHLSNFKYFYRRTAEFPEIISTVPVPDGARRLLAEGIRRQIACYSETKPDWAKGTTFADYTVVFVDAPFVDDANRNGPRITNRDGSPAILVMGFQSAGTAIGVTAHSAVKRPYIVLPHQAESNWAYPDYLRNSADYESEHIREALNDYAEFLRWAHAGDVHPHISCVDDAYRADLACGVFAGELRNFE